jgi:hypothetical protein
VKRASQLRRRLRIRPVEIYQTSAAVVPLAHSDFGVPLAIPLFPFASFVAPLEVVQRLLVFVKKTMRGNCGNHLLQTRA